MSKTRTCEYGCGQEAEYQLKNGKWCCSENYQSCPAIREKNSKTHKKQKYDPNDYDYNYDNCPYCGEEFRISGLEPHKKFCPYNPDNKTYCKECGELLTGKYQSEFCNRSCAAKYNSQEKRNNGFYNDWESKLIGGCNRGYHQTWFGEEVYLRSGQEFDYARKLDEKEVRYEVEELRITYEWESEEHLYILDFYIPDKNRIVEIKGSYFYMKNREKIEKKLEACQDLGYDTLLVVDGEEV